MYPFSPSNYWDKNCSSCHNAIMCLCEPYNRLRSAPCTECIVRCPECLQVFCTDCALQHIHHLRFCPYRHRWVTS